MPLTVNLLVAADVSKRFFFHMTSTVVTNRKNHGTAEDLEQELYVCLKQLLYSYIGFNFVGS